MLQKEKRWSRHRDIDHGRPLLCISPGQSLLSQGSQVQNLHSPGMGLHVQCVQKKHPLLFSYVTFSLVKQFAQKFQCK